MFPADLKALALQRQERIHREFNPVGYANEALMAVFMAFGAVFLVIGLFMGYAIWNSNATFRPKIAPPAHQKAINHPYTRVEGEYVVSSTKYPPVYSDWWGWQK